LAQVAPPEPLPPTDAPLALLVDADPDSSEQPTAANQTISPASRDFMTDHTSALEG